MTRQEKILVKFLKELPIGLALPRATECLAFKKFQLKGPTLDIGCGNGIFSKICFGKKVIDVGLDVNPKEIKLAAKNQVYKKTVVASVKSIPFADSYFQTVLANSSLEHIEGDLEQVLGEINRVLKKGGVLILTAPRPEIINHLFFPRIFKNLKLSWLAEKYINLKNHLWRHHYLLEKKEWQRYLEKTGFKVSTSFTLIPKKAVEIHDIFYPLAFLYVIGKKLFNTNFVFRPEWLARFWAKRVVKHCQIFKKGEGTTNCIKAVKI